MAPNQPATPDESRESEPSRSGWIEEWTYNLVVLSFYLPVAAGCLAYIGWTGGQYALETRTVGEQPALAVLIGCCAAIPVVALSWWMTEVLSPLQRLGQALVRMTGPLSLVSSILVAAAAAFGEELLFRAVLQEQLGAGVGVVLFAAAHVPLERDLWLWPVLALAAGALFAGLYEATGAVLAPATAHFLINAINLRWLTLRFAGASPGSAR
ncbi:MAG: CPBP family intramembrane glutamic endopeptidase [Myxococcota bacterium]